VRKRVLIAAGVLAVAVSVSAAGVYAYWDRLVPRLGRAVNYVRVLTAPAGTISTELAANGAVVPRPEPPTPAATGDWPSYNKTLTSQRYSDLGQINTRNANRLQILCMYDTQQYGSFQAGLLMVNGALIGTTEHDIFSLDPATCHENWRVSDGGQPGAHQAANRGAAYWDGMLFRGSDSGPVRAYDAATGRRVWETAIADAGLGETTPAAPIAWNGLVFIGNAGGDNKGVKGRMYALDAKTGRIVWEFYLVPKAAGDPTRGPQGATPLDTSTWQNASATPISGGATWTSYTLDPATGLLYVPAGNPAPDFATRPRGGENLYSGSVVVLDAKTGAYRTHFKLVPGDWHDWDVSSAPALIRTRAGRHVLAVAPKDGHLYGFDLADGSLLYRTPVTRIDNADATFAVGRPVHFCPGTLGGAEWNGPAYDPPTNLILVGEVEWCTTVTLADDAALRRVQPGHIWSGMATANPYHTWGVPDGFGDWAGWLYAVDADSGGWRWRLKSNYPILGGVTPTAGGVVLFGDMGGNFYVLDAADGRRLWGRKIGGAIGGGVITYTAGGAQKIAVATGLTSILWPTEVVTGKVVVLGLRESAAVQ
jgi:alcohol dehydrogenase (cytochrome c)